MAKVYESVLKPASGGFGMYDLGEFNFVDGIETADQWADAANENGFNVREASELDGKVYGQSGAKIYAIAPYNPATGETDEDRQSFHAVSVED